MKQFLQDPTVQKIIRDVLIALLVSLLSVLGYDQAVAQPRLTALQRTITTISPTK